MRKEERWALTGGGGDATQITAAEGLGCTKMRTPTTVARRKIRGNGCDIAHETGRGESWGASQIWWEREGWQEV
jgi:hypothetical protein